MNFFFKYSKQVLAMIKFCIIKIYSVKVCKSSAKQNLVKFGFNYQNN